MNKSDGLLLIPTSHTLLVAVMVSYEAERMRVAVCVAINKDNS